MAKVKLIKDPPLGSLPQTWSLVRVGTGPGRGEGTGFASVKEAEEFAVMHGHEIAERENSFANGVERGDARYGTRANNAVILACRCGHSAKNHRGWEPQMASDSPAVLSSNLGPCAMTECGCHEYRAVAENAAPVGAMTLLIDGDLGREAMPVADIRDASRKYREYVERNDLGSSQVSFGRVVVGGEQVAEVWYNGRVVLENKP